MFPINISALPTLRTRQALIILDLQNDFISPSGALPVSNPDDLVPRIVRLAKAFRESGTGDVIWVRTQFDGHRSLSIGPDGSDLIITTDAPLIHTRSGSSRGRPPMSGRHEEAIMEADHEAFLTVSPDSDKPSCVRPDTDGAQLAPEAREVAEANKDIIFTKTNYSAFAAGQQLVQMLRGRFVTEIYVCGALTNISIYATALDAGRHGYEITLIDDCCGYRSDMRHSNSVNRLMQLTGCEVTTAQDIISKLKLEKLEKLEKSKADENMSKRPEPKDASAKAAAASLRARSKESAASSDIKSAKPAVGQSSPEAGDDLSSTLPASLEKLTLSGESPSASAVSSHDGAQPQHHSLSRDEQTLESLPETTDPNHNPRTRPSEARPRPTAGHLVVDVNSAPLEVDADLVELSSIDSYGFGESQKRKAGGRTESQLPKAKTGKVKGSTRAFRPASGPVQTGSRRSSSQHQSDNSSLAQDVTVDKRSAMDGQDSLEITKPTASEPLCEGDTTIISNALPEALAATAFQRLKDEVAWSRMSHQGGEVPRLVAVQGTLDEEGNMPVYRHPADESPPLLPFSPTVAEIKAETEKHVGHALNHVLIQFYRDGNDYISEHSDKTLDIVRGSFIANVSLGAERTMVFRTKRLDKDPSRNSGKVTITSGSEQEDTSAVAATGDETAKRRTERASLPHNSLCRMGLATNMRWLHAIRQDKRLDRDKTEAEMAFGGARISLTFRRIGTFLDASQSHIWGQGAVAKSEDEAGAVVNGQTAEAISMLRAFGTENHASDFDWEKYYGHGFNVLHVKAAPRLFFSPDTVVNMRVAMMLAELGMSFAKGSTGAGAEERGNDASIKFVDNDPSKSSVEGQAAIMLYLDAVYFGSKRNELPAAQAELAKRFTRFQAALSLLDTWRSILKSPDGGNASKAFHRELAAWEGYASESETGATSSPSAPSYIAGGQRPSIADFALWPVFHDMEIHRQGMLDDYKCLAKYYALVKGSKAGAKVVSSETKAASTALPARGKQ